MALNAVNYPARESISDTPRGCAGKEKKKERRKKKEEIRKIRAESLDCVLSRGVLREGVKK